MVGMSETTNSPTPIEVPVRTRGWQSMVMVVCAGFMCLAQTAFAAQRFGQDSAVYVWMVFCMLVAFAIGFLLLARSRYPRATFVAACVVVLVFPYDPILALMALTALLARRNDMKTTVRAIVAGGFVTLAAQVRDALRLVAVVAQELLDGLPRRYATRCGRRRHPSGIWCSPNRIPAANMAPA